jgi:hypothetical protein
MDPEQQKEEKVSAFAVPGHSVKAEAYNTKSLKDQEKAAQDIAALLAAAKPAGVDKTYLDLETTKAIMEKVTQDKNLPSTTNINRTERWELIKLRIAYHYSGNPVLLIIADSHMKLNRSLTYEPISVLKGLFGMTGIPDSGDNPGRWGRLKQFVGGR